MFLRDELNYTLFDRQTIYDADSNQLAKKTKKKSFSNGVSQSTQQPPLDNDAEIVSG